MRVHRQDPREVPHVLLLRAALVRLPKQGGNAVPYLFLALPDRGNPFSLAMQKYSIISHKGNGGTIFF